MPRPGQVGQARRNPRTDRYCSYLGSNFTRTGHRWPLGLTFIPGRNRIAISPGNLAKDFDVYAFGYAQITALDVVVYLPLAYEMQWPISRMQVTTDRADRPLRWGRYCPIVCRNRTRTRASPKPFAWQPLTLASDLAHLKGGYHKVQATFIQSLAPLRLVFRQDASED